jgi:hypothetical protein
MGFLMRRFSARLVLPWLGPLAALVLAAGCNLEKKESISDDESSGSSGGSQNGNGSASGAGGSLSTSTSCPTQEIPPNPVRRLTRFEYANSVRALLQVEPSAAAELPADEITNSFDNNAGVLTVSSLHAEKYVLVSEALAKAAVQNLSALTTCDTAAQGEEACARAFAQSMGRRAFRRPITANDEQALMTAYSAGRTGGSYAEGLEVMIRAMLQSANFLFRLETTTPPSDAPLVPLSQFELATRLSYLIWASGPDDALLDAAERGQLSTKEEVATKAWEMLSAPAAHVALSNFVSQWIGERRLDITAKDTNLFPEFTGEVREAMRAELLAFVDYVLWTGDHTLKTLLTAPVAFVNEPLAQVYGVTAPAGATTELQMVELPAEQGRAGLLTQAGFLSVQAHPDQTSPVLRGKFVRTMLLCQPPPPPPPDVDISPPEIDPNATARERFSAHQEASAGCNTCHDLMDPIGFSFESFDAMGRHRTMDGSNAIDLSGEILRTNDSALQGPYDGVSELAGKLSESTQVRNCVATQLFRFASGRLEADQDACSLATMQESFTGSEGDLLELIVAMTQTDAFFNRRQ